MPGRWLLWSMYSSVQCCQGYYYGTSDLWSSFGLASNHLILLLCLGRLDRLLLTEERSLNSLEDLIDEAKITESATVN